MFMNKCYVQGYVAVLESDVDMLIVPRGPVTCRLGKFKALKF